MLGFLINRPILSVNLTCLFGGEPLKNADRYIVKQALDRRSGRVLSMSERLTYDYIYNFRDFSRYEYIDNTEDEILAVTREMLSALRSAPEETSSQRKYREMLVELTRSEAMQVWMTNSGLPRTFYLGHARIGDEFARQNLYPRTELAHA
jgi:hypothetical protein